MAGKSTVRAELDSMESSSEESNSVGNHVYKRQVEASLFQLGVYLLANTGEYNLNVLLLTHLAEVGE